MLTVCYFSQTERRRDVTLTVTSVLSSFRVVAPKDRCFDLTAWLSPVSVSHCGITRLPLGCAYHSQQR